MRRATPSRPVHSEEDVPWASFADALTGLLFVFILLALSFAHQLQKATRDAKDREEAAEAKVSQARRAQALVAALIDPTPEDNDAPSVAACLEKRLGAGDGVQVRAMPTADEARLSLYLQDDGRPSIEWFNSGYANLGAGPCAVARAIGPCLEDAFGYPELGGEDKEFRLRVFVEGHTDKLPVTSGGSFPTNWELSGARAAAVVRAFMVPDGRAADCTADPDSARRLADRAAGGDLEVVAVGMAERKPAWKRLCDTDPADPVCACLDQQKGRPEGCAAPLTADMLAQGEDARRPPADQLIAWANRPLGANEDARRRLLRRVDLRFEVSPRTEGEEKTP